MTAGIAVEALTVTVGDFHLQKLDFAVSRGEILVLLGPNGAGKSITLETIAGFHRPDSGRVLIGGRDATALPPEQRKVGFVVQSFGLFPHLSVAQNIAIARRAGPILLPGNEKSPGHGDAAALLDYFGIAHLARRAPQDLSPGEKQRVALARALAGGPDLFLFDEPFAALDAQTRLLLRDELLSFLRRLSIPAILVTHDYTDAITLADKLVVLRNGGMVQRGAAADVLQRPNSAFVARFLGVENVLPGRVTAIADGLITLDVGKQTLRATAPAQPAVPGNSLFMAIRAEDVLLFRPPVAHPPEPGINSLEGRIIALRHTGPLVTVTIDCGFPLSAYVLSPQARQMRLDVGSEVAAQITAASVHLMTE
jgi:molybdate/tungstate transport system ATP-binding protein